MLKIFLSIKEEENYYKSVRVSNFWSNNYNEYESNAEENKILSIEEKSDAFKICIHKVITQKS